MVNNKVYNYKNHFVNLFKNLYNFLDLQLRTMERNVQRPIGQIPDYSLHETRAIHNINRIITCDDWFTAIPIMKTMLLDPYTPITGTL